jgi:hypothetical protein
MNSSALTCPAQTVDLLTPLVSGLMVLGFVLAAIVILLFAFWATAKICSM